MIDKAKTSKIVNVLGLTKLVARPIYIYIYIALISAALFNLFSFSFFSDSASAATYELGLATSGNVEVDVSVTGNGTAVASDNLVVTSTCPLGYTITIQGPSDNNLYLGGDSSNTSTNTKITASTGTKENPVTITGANRGTWGYSLTSSTGTGTFIGLTSTATTLITKTSASGDGTSTTDTIPVYYGVSALPTQAPGTYKLANAQKINYAITAPIRCTANTVTLNLTNASSIIIDDTTYTASDSPVSLSYGTHTISGTFPQGYEFDSWSTTGDINIADASASSTTINVTGDGTLSLVGKKAISTLYDTIAAMSKGTQTLAELRTAITTANSGVYEYNASVFGAATDAASTHTIYYYRGILDQTTGSYGSDGDGKAWPNYVILDEDGTKDTSDTCWRIVRTTGSGGVKMIYNGKWTGSTCANAQTAAQVTTKAFGGTAAATYRSIVGIGYTRNANYAKTTATTATAYSTLFGSNSSYSGNSTASDMKTYLEGTWFTNISSYESILEKSAGWCNDRSIRSSSSSTSVISDSTTIVPYGTSGMTQYYFGSYVRTRTTADKPTLGCPRSNADLYTTSSATNGNKQLGKPVALITADEAAFAGSGYSSSTTPYHANSFLRSGSYFWLFSPIYRLSSGYAYGFSLGSNGNLNNNGVYNAYGVRPSISLASGTTPTSGSGTATDPWVVQP